MNAIVKRARALVGTPFRAQGRDPARGLDCVGVIVAAFRLPAEEVRRDYRLGGHDEAELEAELGRWFVKHRRAPKPGEVVLYGLTPRQSHLAVHCGESIVHADARLRKVVERPGSPPWRMVGTFRIRRKAGAK